MIESDGLGYYRHPTIHGDALVFCCEDDLWSVSTAGGVARRLTANPGPASFPRHSPDGRWIAYNGSDDGPVEVYVMPAAGGTPRRLTWTGGLTQVVGWHPDGQSVLFASAWRQPFAKSFHLHSVPLVGGPPQPLKLGPARAVSFDRAGAGVVLGRNSGDPARWKRYRGGTAGTIWVDSKGDGNFRPLLELPGNLASPMWLGQRIYFLSDHEGFGNLYSCSPSGRDLKRHTDHEDFYVRFPADDGRRIAYHAGADLHVFDSADGSSRKLEVHVSSARPQRNRKFVAARQGLESFRLHPAGHSLAAVSRGGLYAMGLWEGSAGRLGKVSEVRYRLARWLPEGTHIVATDDEAGDENLVVLAADGGGKPRRIRGDFGRALDIEVAPAGNLLALANERQELIVIDWKRGRGRVIERSPFNRIEGLAWSADGRWLAYGFPSTLRTCSIRLLDTQSGEVSQVTREEFRDVRPSFDPDGNYLYYLSWRAFDPVYDNHFFDLGFPRGMKPMLLPLRRDVVSPFAPGMRAPRPPSLDDSSGGEDKPSEATRKAEKKGTPRKLEIDFDDIENRSIAFPVGEGLYGRIFGLRGMTLMSSFPIMGSLEQSWSKDTDSEAEGIVEVWDFEKQRLELLSDAISDFHVAPSASVVALRVGHRVRVVHSNFRIERKPESNDAGRESGWVDLDRLLVEVVPAAEWRQMFLEAWRLQRDHFWTPDMSGVNWEEVRDRYLPLVDRCASRAEFSDLLWELQGELGTSHCYELGGDYRPAPLWHQGMLGADLELDAKSGSWRVARIPRGDSWEERASSPLAAPGLAIRAGDEILAVDGKPVGRDASPYQRLVNFAGREVQIKVRSRGRHAPKGERVVTVKTLRDEQPLRYRDWVESNRAYVHAASKGRVGYVHVPDMGPGGYAEFHRYYRHEVENDALLIDVRNNGGGHVSQLLLEKLARRRVGYDRPRWGSPESYPSHAPKGPVVALTNEMAGSDGDIFSHCFKLYGLGPLIGKRTWGGVIGIWPRHSLADGSITTQAEFATWFEDVGWGVENYGTDPDIEIDIRPQDYRDGVDPQLDRALRELEKMLAKRPPSEPSFSSAPSLRPGRLPAQLVKLPLATARKRKPRS